MSTYYYLLILSCFYLTTSAQAPYHWTLTEDDGLPDMEIYDLYQDSKGYMWIATDGGLCRYDGKNIVPYSSPLQKRTSTASIQEDAKGTIWYKNFSGQLFFIDSSHQVQLFPLPDSIQLNAYFEYSFTPNQLNITSFCYFYHYQFDCQQWIMDTIAHNKQCLVKSLPYHYLNNSSLLYISDKNELWLQRNGQFFSKGFFSRYIVKKYNTLMQLGEDTVLLRTSNSLYVAPIDRLPQLREEDLLLEQPEILKIYTKKDNLLIATRQGLLVFQKNKSTASWERKDLFLKDKQISAVYIDRDENLWLGTLGEGVFIIPSLKMTYFDAQNSALPNSTISALTKMNETNLLVGMKGRISKFDTESLALKHYPPIDNYPVLNMLVDKKRNQLLFNTNKAYLLSLSNKRKTAVLLFPIFIERIIMPSSKKIN